MSCYFDDTAKKKASGSDGVPEKSDKKLGRGGSEIFGSLSEKESGRLESASETQRERESEGIEMNRRKERIIGEKTVNSSGISLSKAEDKDILIGNDTYEREEGKVLRLEQRGSKKEIRFHDRHLGCCERPDDYWVRRDDLDMRGNRSELVDMSTGEDSPRLQTTAKTDQWAGEREGLGIFYSNSGALADHRGYPTFAYPDEGPSNYKPRSFYDYGEVMKHDNNLERHNRIEHLEQNRAHLLRKLEELKDQVSRSLAVENKVGVPVDRTLRDPCVGRDVYNVSMQPSAPDSHVLRRPYFNRTHGNIPFTNCHNRDTLNLNFYPHPRHVKNDFPAYADPYKTKITGRPLHQPHSQYSPRPAHEYFLGRHMEFNQDHLASYQPETFYHQDTCSCLHCHNRNWQAPPRSPAPVFSNRSVQKDPINANFFRRDDLGPQRNKPQVSNPSQLTSWDPKMRTRPSSDLDSDIDGLGQIRPKRMVAAQGNGKLCHPVAGGAPFITCYNCCELLKLPKKLKTMRNQQKLQCGGCSTMILFGIVNKKLILYVTEETKQVSAAVEDGSEDVSNENHPSSHGGYINSCSEDFDNSGDKFDLTDCRNYLQSEDERLNISEPENRQGFPTSYISSSSSESTRTAIVQGDVSCCAEQPLRDDLSPKLSGSALQDHSYCPNHEVSKYGHGNNSKRVDQDKTVLSRITSRQNSVKEVSMATELDVSFSDYLNTSVSQDSVEVSKGKDEPKINKATESAFVGFIKKSFREFSRSTQGLEDERPNVSVNGQPIPHHLVKKAEKLAGPIQPGDYW